MIAADFNKLIQRIALKDKTALEEIYCIYGKKVKWIGFCVTGDWYSAEDVLIMYTADIEAHIRIATVRT